MAESSKSVYKVVDKESTPRESVTALFKRSVTGACIVIAVITAIQQGAYTFFALCVLVSLLGLFEFYRLFGITQRPVNVICGFLLAAGMLGSALLYINFGYRPAVFLINVPLVSLLLVSSLFTRSENPFYDIGIVFLGQIYITLALILFYGYAFMTDGTYNFRIVLGYFLYLWASDTGAYVFGNLVGERKLAPAISPHKTWEGTVGGAFLVTAVACVNFFFLREFSLSQWLVIALIVVVMGTLGDLVKSVMKRSFNVKDFGNMLPGHGGIIDRFDSLIGSAPVVYAYLSLFYHPA